MRKSKFEISLVIPGIVIVFAMLISVMALAVCFDSCDRRIARRQAKWIERADGGIEQTIESPPRRTKSKSIKRGDVSKED